VTLAEELRSRIEKTTLKCPECNTPLLIFWGRNGRRFNIHHSTTACILRFHDFGHGKTEGEAWASAREEIQATTDHE